MRIIKHLFWCIAHNLIYFVSSFVPKKDNIWIFGAWNGFQFSDNSKYLFLYVLNNYPEINAIWITKDKELAKKIQQQGYKCFYFQSYEGIRASVRARVVFTTSGLADVAEWAHARALHVNLWHGTPLKKIWWDNKNWESILYKNKWEKGKKLFFPYLFRSTKNDIYMVSSKKVQDIYRTAFRADSNRVFVTGQPRNDVFASSKKSNIVENILKTHLGAKIVCYLPTHRNFGTKNNNPLSKDVLLDTDRFLKKNNIVLIFKPHVHEMKHYIDIPDSLTNIIFGNSEDFSDVYSFLPDIDLLISDYSSVYVDFICSSKPIILFPYDLQDYLNSDAGLYRPYHDIAPGPICYEWGQVLEVLASDIFTQSLSEKYIEVQRYYNSYLDGHNCERVCKIVASKVGIEER